MNTYDNEHQNQMQNQMKNQMRNQMQNPRMRRPEPQKRRKKRSKASIIIIIILYVVVFALGIFVGRKTKDVSIQTEAQAAKTYSIDELPDYVDQQIIPINGVGRRGEKLEKVNDIVIHYTGNPGTTAEQNQSYYSQPETEVSSHFLIGMDGKVILCVPLDEKSSATSERNIDTISIEVCHPDESGKFTDAAYESLTKLVAWLCNCYGFDTSHVIRHYDATGKICPKYYVDNPDAWEQMLKDIDKKIEKKKTSKFLGLF